MGRNLALVALAALAVIAIAMGVTGSYQTIWAQLRSLPAHTGAAARAASLTTAQQQQLAADVETLQSHPLTTDQTGGAHGA